MFVSIAAQCLLVSLVIAVSEHPILIVVSYDAFRFDYFNRGLTPNMGRLRKEGSYAEYLYNVFPTKTFPNHHSIATGLYPEVHGVVGNSYYNVAEKKVVNFSYEMFHYNDDIVPIWRLNEGAEAGRYSGVMMWPGGSFKYQDKLPTHFMNFISGYDWNKRVDMIVSWLVDPVKPANLVMLYFEEPDVHGHIYGTDAKEMNDTIAKLDQITLYLETELQAKGLGDKVHVIHLSDHGMISVSPPNFIDITTFLPANTYAMAGSSPCLHIIPNEGYEEQIYNLLKNDTLAHGHYRVFKKNELLDRWHYKGNKRVPPLFLLADEGYAFQDLKQAAEKYSKQNNYQVTNTSKFGVHGYDNQNMNMHPFFMARGPKVRRDNAVKPFDTVDLMSLFCEILEIRMPPNNGSFEHVRDIMSKSPSLVPLIVIIGGVLLTLTLITCAGLITLLVIKKRQRITTTAALNKRFAQTFSHSKVEIQHLLDAEDA